MTEQAVGQRTVMRPAAVRRAVLEASTTPCSCGAPTVEVTIDHVRGKIIGRCAKHRESKVSLAERRQQLAGAEGRNA
jgi:hypothetical protein